MDPDFELLDEICHAFEAIHGLELDLETSEEFGQYLDEYYQSIRNREPLWERN